MVLEYESVQGVQNAATRRDTQSLFVPLPPLPFELNTANLEFVPLKGIQQLHKSMESLRTEIGALVPNRLNGYAAAEDEATIEGTIQGDDEEAVNDK